jgi:hypothetical protein
MARMTSQVLNSKTWRQKDGKDILISEMSLPHVYNTLALLERSAQGIAFSYAFDPVWFNAPDDVQSEVEQALENPLRWLRSSPLYVALLKRAKAARKEA